MLSQVKRYLRESRYDLDAADLAVIAGANFLGVNLIIFCRNAGKISVIKQPCSRNLHKEVPTIFLVLETRHYDAVLDMTPEEVEWLNTETASLQRSTGSSDVIDSCRRR